MNIVNLLKELDELGVPKRYYSIDGKLLSDSYVLNEVYGKWEYFYFDERGNKNNCKIFDDENEACLFFLNVLKNEIRPKTYEL